MYCTLTSLGGFEVDGITGGSRVVSVHHRHLSPERRVGGEVQNGGSYVMVKVCTVKVDQDGHLHLVPATFTGLPVL